MIRYLHSTRSNNPIYFLDSFGIYKLNANSNQLEQSTKKVKKKIQITSLEEEEKDHINECHVVT